MGDVRTLKVLARLTPLRGFWVAAVAVGSGLALESFDRSHQLHYKGRADPWGMAFGLLFTVGGLWTAVVLRRQRASSSSSQISSAVSKRRLSSAMLLSCLIAFVGFLLFGNAEIDNLVLYVSRADMAAQLPLNSLAYNPHFPSASSSLKEQSISTIQTMAPHSLIVEGAAVNPNEVSFLNCIDGSSCHLVSLASRSTNGTCWYIVDNVARDVVDGFQPGLSFGGDPTAPSCSAGTPGRLPTPTDGWQRNSFPQSWK